MIILLTGHFVVVEVDLDEVLGGDLGEESEAVAESVDAEHLRAHGLPRARHLHIKVPLPRVHRVHCSGKIRTSSSLQRKHLLTLRLLIVEFHFTAHVDLLRN